MRFASANFGPANFRWAVGVLTAAFVVFCPGCWPTRDVSTSRPTPPAGEESIVMTIVYDNNPGQEGLTTAWGFGCVIQGLEKTILFDTGGDGETLLGNMQKLGLDPKSIDVVVLSHIHGDHTGGLASFLEARTGLPVYMPAGFPASFKADVRTAGAEPREADDSETVCLGVRTTGTLGRGAIEEHGLCVKTREGWVVITGCAHPGVANIAAQAKEITGGPIRLVMGGFHMLGHSKAQINRVIDRFEELGVQAVAPCHCTGDGARKLFKEHFGENCTLAGVGSVFRFQPAEEGAE
jgi:7,8-dihydropterin-6-yl-methyl-4-(beta-D-ribofuranosyl)aminobenzene 5'-phosphate synthase